MSDKFWSDTWLISDFDINRSVIISFLIENNHFFCDDCLSIVLHIFPRQQVNKICGDLVQGGNINRFHGTCYQCNKEKKVNRILGDTRKKLFDMYKDLKNKKESEK